jgi:hypothetical protein
MEADLERKEPASVEMAIVATHPEESNEESTIETVGTLKERNGDQYPRKRIQGNGEPWQKLAFARERLTRRTIPAPRRGHGQGRCTKSPLRTDVYEGTSGETEKEQRHNEAAATTGKQWNSFNDTFRQNLGPEILKRAVEFSIGLRKMSDWIFWRTRPPRKRKRRKMVIHLDDPAP